MTRRIRTVLIIMTVVLVAVMSTAIGLTAAVWDSSSGGKAEYGPNIGTIDWNSWTKYFEYEALEDRNGATVTSYTGTNLGDVIIPLSGTQGTVKEISNNIFSTTTKELPITIYISATVEQIQAAAFSNLPNLEKVVFASTGDLNGVEVTAQSVTVGAYCFAGCANLKEIVIEGNRSVTFDPTAFIGCTSLETITGYTSEQIDALNI